MEQKAEEVFISPRVLDGRAFEEYSNTLRSLIEDAESRCEALRRAAGEVRGLGQGLRDATQELGKRLEEGVRCVSTLETGTDKLEALLNRAAEKAEATEQAGSRLDEMAEASLSRARTQIDALVVEAEKRLNDAAEARLSRTEAACERLEGLLARIEPMRERADALEADLEPRLERLSQWLRTQVESVRTTAEQAVAPTMTALNEAADRASALVDPADAGKGRLAEAVDRAERALGSLGDLEARLGGLKQAAEESLAAMNEGLGQNSDRLAALAREHETLSKSIEGIETGCRETETMLESQATRMRELTEAPLQRFAEEAGRVCKELETAREAARREGDAVRPIVDQAKSLETALRQAGDSLEPWREMLTPPDNETLPEPVQALVDRFRERLGAELDAAGAALREMSSRALLPVKVDRPGTAHITGHISPADTVPTPSESTASVQDSTDALSDHDTDRV